MGLAMASFLESGFKGKSRQLSGRSCALGFTFTTHPGDLIFFFLLPSYFLIPLEQNVSLSLFFFSLSWLSVLSSSSTPRCPLHYLNWSSTLYPNHYHTSVNMHFSLLCLSDLAVVKADSEVAVLLIKVLRMVASKEPIFRAFNLPKQVPHLVTLKSASAKVLQVRAT
jgi:hypothetical protein